MPKLVGYFLHTLHRSLQFVVFTFTMTKILLDKPWENSVRGNIKILKYMTSFLRTLRFFEEGLLVQLGLNPSTYFYAFQNLQSFGT